MEPEGSLPNSQVPATCPYPEQDRSITTTTTTYYYYYYYPCLNNNKNNNQ